jgi:hypothetical protein
MQTDVVSKLLALVQREVSPPDS